MTENQSQEKRQRVADANELETDGDNVVKEVKGREIGIFYVDGEYYAVLNWCCHADGPLCEGELTGRYTLDEDGFSWNYEDSNMYIECPWHQWKFDIRTGENLHSSKYTVPVFNVVEDDGLLYLEW